MELSCTFCSIFKVLSYEFHFFCALQEREVLIGKLAETIADYVQTGRFTQEQRAFLLWVDNNYPEMFEVVLMIIDKLTPDSETHDSK